MADEAFEAFFRAMHPRLVGYASRRVGYSDADDIASRTMMRMWCKLRDLGEEPTESTRRLAYLVADGYIRNWRRALLSAERLRQELESHWSRSETEMCSDVPQWIGSLEARDLQLLSMSANGYRTGEIANMLGCTPGAVSMRIARARSRARSVVNEWMIDSAQVRSTRR